LNGNPLVEPGYLSDGRNHTELRSALAVPLEGSAGVIAVLAFYRTAQDAFTKEDLEVAEIVASRMAALMEQPAPKAARAAGAH
jgi:GAF domain-containing protein